jgi:integrating conjugative element protein (TIGR03761 family)
MNDSKNKYTVRGASRQKREISVEEKIKNLLSPDGFKELVEAKEAFMRDPKGDDPIPKDSRFYQRYMTLIDAKREQVNSQNKTKDLSISLSNRVEKMGKLSLKESDMILHTKEASRLFHGQIPSEGKHYIAGGKRVASCLSTLSLIAGNNNPFADWYLIESEKKLRELISYLKDEIKNKETVFQKKASKGIHINLMENKNPAKDSLLFKTGYGFTIANIIVEFDLLVRYIKTLQMCGEISDQFAREELIKILRKIRGRFNEILKLEKKLNREKINTFTRVDFIAKSPLLKDIIPFLGLPPLNILVDKESPEHRARKISVPDMEAKKLETVWLELSQQISN